MAENDVMAECLQFRLYGDRNSNMRELARAFGCRPGLTDGDDVTLLSMVTCIIPVRDGKDGCIGTGVFAFPHVKGADLEEMAGRMSEAIGVKLEKVRVSETRVREMGNKAEKALDDAKELGKPGIPYLSHAYIAVQSGRIPLLFCRGEDLGRIAREGLIDRVKAYEASVIVMGPAEKGRTGGGDRPDRGRSVPITVLVPHEDGRGERSR